MKNRKVNFQKLWSKSNYDISGLKLARGSKESFYEKSIDSLCLEADMCETLELYVSTLCDGMNRLFDLGISKQDIIKHKILFPKLLHLGEDIVESCKSKSDLFYLGLFIDAKLSSNWFTRSFYSLIKKSIKSIKEQGSFFSEKMKFQIEEMIQEANYALYKTYFTRKGLKLIT